MSTLKVNELDTKSGTTITVAAGKTLAGTDIIDTAQIAANAVDSSEIAAGAVTNAKTDFQPGTIFKGDGSSADGKITLNCSQNTHGVSIQSPAHASAATYTLTLPTTDGNADEFMQTDGSGVLTWATVAGGLTQASQWRLHTTFTNDQDPIAANLEENDTNGYSRLGSAMVESSGVYTFPATGYWWVQGNFFLIQPSNGAGGNACNLSTTIDNGTTWLVASQFTMGDYYGDKFEGTTSYLFDVTDTAQCKVRFGVNVTLTDTATQGSSTQSLTYFTFMRLADT